MYTSHTLCAVFLVALAGCGEPLEPSPEATPGLLITSLTGTEIEASYRAGDLTIEVIATEVEPDLIDIAMTLGEQSLYARIDLAAGEGSYDLDGVVFDAASRDAVAAMHLALAEALETEQSERMTPAEDQLLRTSAFLGTAPTGKPLGRHQFVADKSWVHLSCGCYRKYIGNGYYRTAGKGSWCTGGYGNGCKGRCGVGCGVGGHGAYTRDCALHDYGLGSWWSASDDFSFAAWNC